MGADRVLVAADRDGRLREPLRGDDEPPGPEGEQLLVSAKIGPPRPLMLLLVRQPEFKGVPPTAAVSIFGTPPSEADGA